MRSWVTYTMIAARSRVTYSINRGPRYPSRRNRDRVRTAPCGGRARLRSSTGEPPAYSFVGRAGDDLIRRLLDLRAHRAHQRAHPEPELIGSDRDILLL